jgi:hypothetical protein
MTTPNPLSPEEMEALRAAAEKATPGPWVVWSSLYERMAAQLRSADTTVEGVALAEFYGRANGYCNASFIALANPASILRLLAQAERVRELEARVAAATKAAQIALGQLETWAQGSAFTKPKAGQIILHMASVERVIGELRAALKDPRP